MNLLVQWTPPITDTLMCICIGLCMFFVCRLIDFGIQCDDNLLAILVSISWLILKMQDGILLEHVPFILSSIISQRKSAIVTYSCIIIIDTSCSQYSYTVWQCPLLGRGPLFRISVNRESTIIIMHLVTISNMISTTISLNYVAEKHAASTIETWNYIIVMNYCVYI